MSRSKSSSALAALYLLALPGLHGQALSGPSSRTSAETPANSAQAAKPATQSKSANAVVVVTGTFDLAKVRLSDFGDLDHAKR